MINNFKNNHRYYFMDRFAGELVDIDRDNLATDFDKDGVVDTFKSFLNNECGERFSTNKLIDFFGLAFVSSGDFALLTLNTNAYVFIDDEYYMDFLALDVFGEVYVGCISHKTEEVAYYRI